MRFIRILQTTMAVLAFIGIGPPTLGDDGPKTATAVKGLPPESGDRRFALVEINGAKHAVAIDGHAVYLDRDGNLDFSGPDEKVSGLLEDRGTPLYRGKATVLATVPGLQKPISALNVEWDPTASSPGVLVTTGTGEEKLELAFCPWGPKLDAAPLLRFGSNDRVLSVYGEPFAAHGAMGDDQPTLVVRVGRMGSEKVFVSQFHTKLTPENNPKASITFNPGTPEAVTQQVVLNHRC